MANKVREPALKDLVWFIISSSTSKSSIRLIIFNGAQHIVKTNSMVSKIKLRCLKLIETHPLKLDAKEPFWGFLDQCEVYVLINKVRLYYSMLIKHCLSCNSIYLFVALMFFLLWRWTDERNLAFVLSLRE